MGLELFSTFYCHVFEKKCNFHFVLSFFECFQCHFLSVSRLRGRKTSSWVRCFCIVSNFTGIVINILISQIFFLSQAQVTSLVFARLFVHSGKGQWNGFSTFSSQVFATLLKFEFFSKFLEIFYSFFLFIDLYEPLQLVKASNWVTE